MQSYDAVLLGHMWAVEDTAVLGDTLADYVDSGGGIVATYCLRHHGPQGRWVSDAYDPIVRSGISIIDVNIGTVHIPTHPVMGNVSAVTSGFHWPGYYPHPDATIIADWLNTYGDTELLAAELDTFAGPVLSLNMVAYSTDANIYTGWTGDGAVLMANALNYVPEPATLGLLAVGGVIMLRRRRSWRCSCSRAVM